MALADSAHSLLNLLFIGDVTARGMRTAAGGADLFAYSERFLKVENFDGGAFARQTESRGAADSGGRARD